MDGIGEGGSVVPADPGERAARRGFRWRLLFSVLLVAFIGAGLVGVFDPHQGQVQASAGGFTLVVTYPERTRLGLPTHWEVEVSTADGSPLPETVALATTSSYFTLFDQNGFDPDPESASDDGERSILEFTTVPGASSFSTSFDGRVQPSWQRGGAAVTTLLVDGSPVASVRYETRLWL